MKNMKTNQGVMVRDRKVSLKTVSVIALVYIALLVLSSSIPVFSAVSPNIELDDFPAQATYTVKTDGGSPANYWAVRYDGHIAYDSTNASYVINSAITACNKKGTVFLHKGTYTLTKPILIVGNGGADFWYPESQIGLIGEGYSTILSQTGTNENGITISNGAMVNLRDFTIHMPNTNSGHGIYGSDAGAGTKVSVFGSNMDGLNIIGGDSSHACMYIQNPWYSNFGSIWVASSNGDGVVFEATHASLHIGNTNFKHLFASGIPSGKYALTFKATSSGAFINLVDLDQIEACVNGGGIHFQTGVGVGKITDNWIRNMDLECHEKAIYFSGTGTINQNYFQGMIGCTEYGTGETAIDLGDLSGCGNKFDLQSYVPDQALTYIKDYGLNGEYAQNEYHIRFDPTANWPTMTTSMFDFDVGPFTGYPKVTWVGQVAGNKYARNPNFGATASVSNGTWIEHRVGVIPQWVEVTGSVLGEMVSVISKNVTHFRVCIIKHDGTAGTSQTVYWHAGWYN